MNDIIALVTVYFPEEEHVRNIKIISSQVDAVIVIDNSNKDNRKLFDVIGTNIEYVSLKKNRGLSSAFNSVLSDTMYNWHEDDYIVFFDQDSVINENHISGLIGIFRKLTMNGIDIGCLGPSYFNTSNQKKEIPKLKRVIMEGCYLVNDIITSSMLCQYSTLKKIGFWNEDIFLDAADWDLCWRIKKIGKVCCITNKIPFIHSVGIGEKKFFGIALRNSKDIRSYYRTRDFLYLIGKKYTPFRLKIRMILDVTILNILRVIALDNHRERFYYILRGYKDYFLKVKGEFI